MHIRSMRPLPVLEDTATLIKQVYDRWVYHRTRQSALMRLMSDCRWCARVPACNALIRGNSFCKREFRCLGNGFRGWISRTFSAKSTGFARLCPGGVAGRTLKRVCVASCSDTFHDGTLRSVTYAASPAVESSALLEAGIGKVLETFRGSPRNIGNRCGFLGPINGFGTV